MSQMAAALADPVRRTAVVRDAVVLVEREVASKRGLRAMALKGGFKAFKAIQPGIVTRAIEKLLPHFVPVIDPIWAEAQQHDRSAAWMNTQDIRIADALLGVTDGLAAKAKNRVMIRIYKSLRGQAKGHVQTAVPGLTDLLAHHAPVEG
jgi:hypothetical protein